MKKNIRKDIKKNFPIKIFIEMFNIDTKNNNAIIGDFLNEHFNTLENYKQIEKNYELILDLKTFARYKSGEKKNKIIIEMIKDKHFDKLKEYKNFKSSSLILLIDDIFFEFCLKSLKEIFIDNNIYINQNLGTYFLLNITKKSNNNKEFYFKGEIPGFKDINLDKCFNIDNFLTYVINLKNLDLSKEINSLNIYDPYKDKDKYFVTVHISSENNEKFLRITYNNLSKDITKLFEDNKNKYNKILLIYYLDDYNKQEIDYIQKYFLNCEKVETIIAENKDYSKELESEKNNILSDGNIEFIYNNKTNYIYHSYLIDNNKNIRLNKDSIIDNVVFSIFKKIDNIEKNKIENILIEENYGIISLYISENYKKSNITLVGKDFDNSIIKYISKNINNNIDKKNNLNIIEYLSNSVKTYDIIILANQNFPSNNNYFEEKQLKVIKEHLKKEGRFYIALNLRSELMINSAFLKFSTNFTVSPIEFLRLCEYLFECKNFKE